MTAFKFSGAYPRDISRNDYNFCYPPMISPDMIATVSNCDTVPRQSGGIPQAACQMQVNSGSVAKPHKMKFSAIWDVDKIPTNCVPRMCRLNVCRLEIKSNAFLASDLPTAVLLAVKIQGRRRTLRSTEIPLLPAGNFANGGEVDLNMEFCLTYPHFLKRTNHIEILLQRKKHYKNRTIPGYKTLAGATIDMNEILQRPTPEADRTTSDGLTIVDLLVPTASHSLDADSGSDVRSIAHMASLRLSSASEPLPKLQGSNRSDDELSSGVDDNANVNITDSDDLLATGGEDDGPSHHRIGVGETPKSSQRNSKKNLKSMAIGQQTKFKQKIVSLLRKMKVSSRGEASGLVSPPPGLAKDSEFFWDEEDSETLRRLTNRRNSFPPGSRKSLEDLEAEIENWAPNSDDDSNVDGVSLAVTVQTGDTTPKPSLRPFFFSDLRHSSEQLPFMIEESSKSMAPSKENRQFANAGEISASPALPSFDSLSGRQPSIPQNFVLSPGIQLEHIFQTSTELPSHLVLVYDPSLSSLAKACAMLPDGLNVVCASKIADVDVFFAEITRLLQKFTNPGNTSAPGLSACQQQQLKLVLCGSSDAFFAAATHSFVERFSSRLPEAPGIVRLLPIPLYTGSPLAQLLGAVSHSYRTFLESTESKSLLTHLQDLLLLPTCLSRQFEFFSIPVGEILLTIRENRGSRQVVLPFICDVQVNIVKSQQQLGVQSQPGLTQSVPEPSLNQGNGSTTNSATNASHHHHHHHHRRHHPHLSSSQCQPSHGSASSSSTSGSVPFANTNLSGIAEELPTNLGSGSPPHQGPAPGQLANFSSQPGLLPSTSTSGAVHVVPSPEASAVSASSASFDVNIDYWLDSEATSATSSQVQALMSPTTSSNTIGLATASSASVTGGAKPSNVKGSYRQMLVTRTLLNANGESVSFQPNAMTLVMNARDKKIKKIWPNRKSRDSMGSETMKGQTVLEGLNRLVCNVKSSSSGHRVVVYVDGIEYTGVKFFQISPNWHSHIKSFPVFAPVQSDLVSNSARS